MGHINKTPAGHFRANWRDPAGRKKAKTFRTKKEANAFLADIETTKHRGAYVAPDAGKLRFGVFAARWVESRRAGARTDERTASILRTHVLPMWQDWPLGRIDHMSVQRWITALGGKLAPATVGKCFGVLRAILRAAVRARLIALDPTEGTTAPSTYQARPTTATVSPAAFHGALLPAVPAEHHAIVCTAAGAGLRWGECAGLPWGAVDLDKARLRVSQVAVETSGAVVIKPYPKTRAGVRTVPLPGFLVSALRARLALTVPNGYEPRPTALVFGTGNGTPLRRSNFRRQVWRPTLVRAGLLGKVTELSPDRWQAVWPDDEGAERSAVFGTERAAADHVAAHAVGGLRFHDLRHSYATWLVTAGTPINDVQAAMGHEQASTTLNRYTHRQDDYDRRILAAFTDPADFSPTETGESDSTDEDEEDSDTL